MFTLIVKMGKIGQMLGNFLGGTVGKFAGDRFGHVTGIKGKAGRQVGQNVGSFLGNLLPFKKGGKVKRRGKILAHKGEFILPRGVKPSTHQVRIVKKRGGRYR